MTVMNSYGEFVDTAIFGFECTVDAPKNLCAGKYKPLGYAPAKHVTRSCAVCGCEFETTERNVKITCSAACRRKLKQQRDLKYQRMLAARRKKAIA